MHDDNQEIKLINLIDDNQEIKLNDDRRENQ